MNGLVAYTTASLALSAGAFGDVTPVGPGTSAMTYDVDQLWGFRNLFTSDESAPDSNVESAGGRGSSRLVLAIRDGFSVGQDGVDYGDTLGEGLLPVITVWPDGPAGETSLTLVPAPMGAVIGLVGLGGVGLMGVARRRSRRGVE